MFPVKLLVILLALAVVIAAGLAYLYQRRAQTRRQAGESEPPMVSIVALLARPRTLDEATLRTAIERAWAVRFPIDPGDTDDFVAGETPVFMVKHSGRLFVVHNHARPYFDDPAAAEAIRDLRTRKAVQDHRAWLSMDRLAPDNPAEVSADFRRIGRVLAELADGDFLAVFNPADGSLRMFDEPARQLLVGEDPMAVFREQPTQPPVLGIDGDDPRMQAAVAEARRRWPEFVAAFEHRRPEQVFSVKAPFTRGHSTEFMWVNVDAIEGGFIYGTLGNQPVDLPGLNEGDRVRVPQAELNDWVYVSDDQACGGFTLEVLRREGPGSQ